MRLGIADHMGCAVAVAAHADGRVVDRRRVEPVEPGVNSMSVHHGMEEVDDDEVRYRAVLAAAAGERGWAIHRYDARTIEAAVADELLHAPRGQLGPPWTKDYRVALAAVVPGAGGAGG